MEPMTSGGPDAVRLRRRTTARIKESLRELSVQLALLNHQVGARVSLRDVDFSCLDLIKRHGPLSPTELARRAGLHPATITGVVDRLQRAGWVARDRDPEAADRRAVTLRAKPARAGELFELYSAMNSSMDEVCSTYADPELELLADFLRRTTEAGQSATELLARD
jgi:DNA-binding MarR family transcriptional regulator